VRWRKKWGISFVRRARLASVGFPLCDSARWMVGAWNWTDTIRSSRTISFAAVNGRWMVLTVGTTRRPR
jgi:hypothetical protein